MFVGLRAIVIHSNRAPRISRTDADVRRRRDGSCRAAQALRVQCFAEPAFRHRTQGNYRMTTTDLAPTPDSTLDTMPLRRDDDTAPALEPLGFVPPAETYYRIYFSHSDMCMDGRTIHRGEMIKQAKPDPKSDSQLWKFHRVSPGHYMLIAKKSGKALDVPRGSHQENTDMCQWDVSWGAWNEHFRLRPTGDGLFYLEARHSGKRIGVKNGGKADGDSVVQGGNSGEAHFRLRIVQDGESKERVVDRDFVADANEKMRKLIIDVAGKVPEVGSGLAGLLSMLWPEDDKFQRVWQQMKSYVQDLVREMISQERLHSLSNKLAGIQSCLNDYNKEDYGAPPKAGFFTALLAALNTAEPDFFDPREPQQTLPYFIALGSIRLAALREMCMSYKKIFGKDDDKPQVHLEDLRKKIAAFVEGANTARERAIAWRLTKVRLEHTQESSFPSNNHWWSVVADYNGMKKTWYYNDLTSEDKGAEGYARAALPLYQNEVRSQYAAELDAFFGPARLWRYLDPTVTDKPKKVATDILTGPYGGVKFSDFQDAPPAGARITAIDIHAGDHIDGIQLHYDGKPGPLHGKRGGHHLHYDLAANETIVGAWGRLRGEIGAVFLQTNLGRTLGGGWRDGDNVGEWVGDPPDNARATLFSIGGKQGTGHVEALSFIWRYTRDE